MLPPMATSPAGPRSEGATASRLALLAVLGFAAALRLANLWSMDRLPIVTEQVRWPEGDMGFYYAWSGKILAGDVLGRDTPHPYTKWMRSIAPEETWERWWGGRQVFHNAPLYPYLLAAFRLVFGDGFRAIAILQLCIGLAGVALTFAIAGRLFGRTAAVAAGLTASLFGPALLYESFALRDGIAATTALGALWSLVRARDDGAVRWLVAGLLFALAVLARENIAAFAPFIAGWMAWLHWGRWRRLARSAAGFVAGVVLGLLPLAARNVALGVRPWALSPQGIQALALGHVVDANPALLGVTPAVARALTAADGSLVEVLRQIWSTYAGDWRRLAANEAVHLAAIVSSFEGSDNVNWYYLRDRSPVLRLALPFQVVLAFAVVGLIVERRSGGPQAPLWLFLVFSVLSLMVTCVLGRYRLPLAAVLAIYAGAALAWAQRQFAARRWIPLAAACVTGVAIVAVSGSALANLELRMRYRSVDFGISAKRHLERGERDLAIAELQAGLRAAYRGTDQRSLPQGFDLLARTFAIEANQAGRAEEATREIAELAADYPADALLEELLGVLYRDALGRREEAERHFAAAQRLRGGQASGAR